MGAGTNGVQRAGGHPANSVQTRPCSHVSLLSRVSAWHPLPAPPLAWGSCAHTAPGLAVGRWLSPAPDGAVTLGSSGRSPRPTDPVRQLPPPRAGAGLCCPQPGRAREGRWQQLALAFRQDTDVRCGTRGSCGSAETCSAEPSTRLPRLVSGKASTLVSDSVTSPGTGRRAQGAASWLTACRGHSGRLCTLSPSHLALVEPGELTCQAAALRGGLLPPSTWLPTR